MSKVQGLVMGLPTGRRFDLHSRLQGSTPCRSTGKHNYRAQVQMGARLLWEQEDLGSTPRCPTEEALGFRP